MISSERILRDHLLSKRERGGRKEKEEREREREREREKLYFVTRGYYSMYINKYEDRVLGVKMLS